SKSLGGTCWRRSWPRRVCQPLGSVPDYPDPTTAMTLPNEDTLVERPLIEQLTKLGWSHIEGSKEDPTVTERTSFREVLLRDRLRAALRRINRDPEGREWLDDARLNQPVSALERIAAPRLIEANEAA